MRLNVNVWYMINYPLSFQRILSRSKDNRKNVLREIKRKSFHLFSLTVPVIYFLSSGSKVVVLLYIATWLLISILIEVLRLRAYALFPFKSVYDAITRPHERRALAAYVYFLLGSMVVVTFFGLDIAVLAVTTAAIGDALAAIIGTAKGTRLLKTVPRRSFEGTLTGVVAVFLTGLLFTPLIPVSTLSLVFAALTFGFIDVLRIPIDDNFTHPLVLALTLTLLKGYGV